MRRLILTLAIALTGIASSYAADEYGELITLTDGSLIYGLISKDNLSDGNIEIDAYWTMTSVAAKDVKVETEDVRKFRLDEDIREWLENWNHEVPELCTMANITMTGDDCDPEYLIYDQVLSDDADNLDKLLLEDGDILRYVDLTPRKILLDWKKVARVDRNSDDMAIEEEIIDTKGNSFKGTIESQVLRHHRVLKTADGKFYTFRPQSIAAIKKRSTGPQPPLEASPVIETLILEESAGGEELEGVIVENNRENKYFIILLPGDEQAKVTYADVKTIAYRLNK